MKINRVQQLFRNPWRIFVKCKGNCLNKALNRINLIVCLITHVNNIIFFFLFFSFLFYWCSTHWSSSYFICNNLRWKKQQPNKQYVHWRVCVFIRISIFVLFSSFFESGDSLYLTHIRVCVFGMVNTYI